jgi:hypothetical protein
MILLLTSTTNEELGRMDVIYGMYFVPSGLVVFYTIDDDD